MNIGTEIYKVAPETTQWQHRWTRVEFSNGINFDGPAWMTSKIEHNVSFLRLSFLCFIFRNSFGFACSTICRSHKRLCLFLFTFYVYFTYGKRHIASTNTCRCTCGPARAYVAVLDQAFGFEDRQFPWVSSHVRWGAVRAACGRGGV